MKKVNTKHPSFTNQVTKSSMNKRTTTPENFNAHFLANI